VLTQDSSGTTVSGTVIINPAATQTQYRLSISANTTPNVIKNNNYVSTTTYAKLVVNPPLPPGVSMSFSMIVNKRKVYSGPGTGTIVDTVTITKNGVTIPPYIPSSSTTTGTRPDCSPESQVTVTEADTYYPLTIDSTSEFLITSNSVLTITDGEQGSQANCLTNLYTNIVANLTGGAEAGMKGCTCCTQGLDGGQRNLLESALEYTPNSQPVDSCATCQGVIETGTGIFLDSNLYVGGLICSGPFGTGCDQNFRYCDPEGGNCMITDNGVVSSYVCGIQPNVGVRAMVANFQVPTNGIYSLSAEAYLNGVLVGQGGVSNIEYTTNTVNSISLTMFSPINIQVGSVFKIVYKPFGSQ
jgi:hypothetical protein